MAHEAADRKWRKIEMLAQEGQLSTGEIAAIVGSTEACVRVTLSQVRRRRRAKLEVFVARQTIERLRRAAAQRGLSEASVAEAILNAVARDGLIDAVLDDGAR
jgi:hypothetical protein